MPWQRSTLTQQRDGALQDIAASEIYDSTTGQVVNPILLQFDPLTIMAKVLSGLAYEEYGYLDWIALQATPYTATDLEFQLGWGGLVAETLKPATAATGTAQFTGVYSAADTPNLPSGTTLTRSDGTSYITTADALILNTGLATVSFEAVLPGAAGTTAAGAAISIATPIAGITTLGVVTASTEPGADIETPDAFRARYLKRYAAPPNGGTTSDYEQWALAVPGVTRSWAIGGGMGPGTVLIYVMLDGSESAGGGFPVGTDGVSPLDNDSHPRDAMIAAGDQMAVANAIIAQQPITDLVYVSAPANDPIAFTINNLGTGNTEANQAAITAALASMFLLLGDPTGTTIYPSAWSGAIASVLAQFTVAAPLTPLVLTVGQLPTVGIVTFNA